MSLAQSAISASGSLARFRTSITQTVSVVGRLQTAAATGGSSLDKLRGNSDRLNTSAGKLKSALGQTHTGLDKMKTAAGGADGGLGKARTGTDKLKSSFDKLKAAAKGAHGELKGVKQQSDAVEKSVGKAAKNADRGGKSMGGLGKGLKGASLAQKGLNLAMAANPFGLVMTLLTPLIAQFINMDKITKLLQKGVSYAMKAIGSAVGGLVHNAGPLLRGLGNAMLAPMTGLANALNGLLGALAGIHISIPDWVPKFGGRSFGFPRLHVPVPHLATGGVVQARPGGTLALLGEAGENEAVIPLSKLERMLGHGGGLRTLAAAVERLADRPVVVRVDSQEIARAVFLGQRQLSRR
ncbi:MULTISPECIES: hypothetical protein [unclassified Streptomyces]|uniref:hypothetical protein n=1 Tax=unclassified Streptomyces TaxID=2593676 RepID=UPI0004BEB672|nr:MULTISPECIES: hypothetical protein [unclassified Streptomyces]KOX05205.1 hypothetical protein ADL04_06915 [Streptomyces sp. NRRL B-3648]